VVISVISGRSGGTPHVVPRQLPQTDGLLRRNRVSGGWQEN
jgi:hypothetical protein